MKIIPISEIKELNQKAGNYWFEPDTLRFFKSRLDKYAYKKGNKAYFVSSEQSPYGSRMYSVRVADLKTGNINTVGDFMKYGSRESALKEIKKIIG